MREFPQLRRQALALLCLALPPTLGSNLDAISLWPAGAPPPGENGFVCGPERLIVTHGPYADSARYYNVTQPTLTPFLVSNGSGAAIIIAPGGGYDHLAFWDEGTRVAAKLNAGGVSALLLKYRVPMRPASPGAPFAAAQLMDAQRAMGLARENAAAWGLNASRIGFMGFSAGGHLTAHISGSWAERLYPRVDPADDLPCRPDFSLLVYPWRLLGSANATALAPELNVTAAHPPSAFFQNLDDTTAFPEDSLMYARALLLAGAPKGSVHMYPKGGHGFGVCAEFNPVGGFELCCEWPAHALRFLQGLGAAPGWPGNITSVGVTL
jgi:acetyl esterase/lipase